MAVCAVTKIKPCSHGWSLRVLQSSANTWANCKTTENCSTQAGAHEVGVYTRRKKFIFNSRASDVSCIDVINACVYRIPRANPRDGRYRLIVFAKMGHQYKGKRPELVENCVDIQQQLQIRLNRGRASTFKILNMRRRSDGAEYDFQPKLSMFDLVNFALK